MEVPSEDMCDIAFQVFDRYGTIKAKYKDHPVQRGSGIWGNELDYGPLFLFEELHVAAELRRKGLGHKIASLLLDKAKQFCLEDKPDSENADLVYGSNQAFGRAWTLHDLVNPGILTADIESQLAGKSVEERLMIRTRVQFGAIYFWRACGFRRIGASRCFAFSYDSQHPSHTLDAASDFDPRRDYSKFVGATTLILLWKVFSLFLL
jgi:GNAT superfamily N-acetyltransferase